VAVLLLAIFGGDMARRHPRKDAAVDGGGLQAAGAMFRCQCWLAHRETFEGGAESRVGWSYRLETGPSSALPAPPPQSVFTFTTLPHLFVSIVIQISTLHVFFV
jgi:hypothetical protein